MNVNTHGVNGLLTHGVNGLPTVLQELLLDYLSPLDTPHGILILNHSKCKTIIEWTKSRQIKTSYEQNWADGDTITSFFVTVDGVYHCIDGPARCETWKKADNNEPTIVERWIQCGKLHRENGPALINTRVGIEEWYFKGLLHRSDGGPAIVTKEVQEWYFNGKRHRVGGYAYIYLPTNSRQWFFDGEYHRVDGPAIINDTQIAWYQHGKLHRIGGPALQNKSQLGGPDQYFWYQHGQKCLNDGPDFTNASISETLKFCCNELHSVLDRIKSFKRVAGSDFYFNHFNLVTFK